MTDETPQVVEEEAVQAVEVEEEAVQAVEVEEVDPLEKFFGAIVEAKFVELHDKNVRFEFGDGQKAIVPRDEFGDSPPTKAGTTFELLVDTLKRGIWTASHHKAAALAVWKQFQVLAKAGGTVEGKVIACNNGGLIVDVGARGFVPRSQVDLHKVDSLEPFVGQIETFKVLKFDGRSGDVVLSRRALLEDARSGMRAKTLEGLVPGTKFEGIVRRVMPYGAFIDVGGLEGLLHQSNLSWGRESSAKILKPGLTVEVVVLDWDADNNKLSLGRKQLTEDPWETLGDKFTEGDVVKGKVVSLAQFGAFVELSPGIEGLIHNTELSWTDRAVDAKKLLSKGQEVEVKVIGVELENRRLRLSKKRLDESPWDSFAAEHKVGQKLQVKIARIADFGLFCELTESLDGLVHANDISWTEKVDLKATFEPGQEIEVIMLSIDTEAGRVGLGVKQLSDDPWSLAARIAAPGKKIEVTVSHVADFGAFVTVAQDVEGLIHISQLSDERVERVEDIVKPGQTLEATVVSFDLERRRIGLSLRSDAIESVEEDGEYTEDEEARATLGDILPAALRKPKPAVAPADEDVAPDDEEAPDEEAPDEEAPDEEAPDEEAPDEEAPDEEAPDEEAPDEEAPDDENEAPDDENEAPDAEDEAPAAKVAEDAGEKNNK